MSRREFSKTTKRAALARSQMRCEAIGAMYGLATGQRCNADIGKGVEFDHIVLDANSKDSSLENCAAVCIKCHRRKTAKHDIPMAAKTVRMQDKSLGITSAKQKIKSQGFARSEKQPKPATKSLAPRALYQEEAL